MRLWALLITLYVMGLIQLFYRSKDKKLIIATILMSIIPPLLCLWACYLADTLMQANTTYR